MLEQMRKSSQSLLIYFLFGIVIVVFIINFGPQSQSGAGCEGTMGGDESAARVADETVSAMAFRSAFMLLGGGNQPPQMMKLRRFKEGVMDRLIERELLAQEALHLGYRVSEDDVHKMLLEGRIIGLGIPYTIGRIQKDGVFNYDQFKNFTQFELGLTPTRFVEQQQREMLAAEVRNLMRASVKVSFEEVKTAFETKNRQVNLEYVRFPARKFEGEVELTPEQIAAYVKANEAKLTESFTQRKPMFTDMPQEVRLRQILIKSPQEADPAAGDEAARKRAEALAARLAKGEPFVKVAREASDDEEGRGSGGDLGWRRKGTLGLSDAVEAKVFAAKAGETLGPFKSAQAQGWVLLAPGGTRQGTLTFDQVKNELAEEQLKQEKAIAIAKARAESALASAKGAPDKSFKELFPGTPVAAVENAESKGGKSRKAAEAKANAKANASATTTTITPDLSGTRAEETGLFARRGDVVEQIGESPELSKAVWDLNAGNPVAGPFEVAGSYVVVRLKERKDPDPAELEKKKAELQRDAELAKWNDVMTSWIKHRCEEIKTAGRLSVNTSLLKYEDGQEAPSYSPCGGDLPRRPS